MKVIGRCALHRKEYIKPPCGAERLVIKCAPLCPASSSRRYFQCLNAELGCRIPQLLPHRVNHHPELTFIVLLLILCFSTYVYTSTNKTVVSFAWFSTL